MKLNKTVKKLLDKAAAAEKSDDAMKFAQAACNAGNAIAVQANTNKK